MAVKKLKESSSRSTFNYSGYSFEEVISSSGNLWWVSIVPEDFYEDYEAYSEDGETWLILRNGDEVGQETSDDRKEVADILIQYAGLEEGVKSKMAVKKLKESKEVTEDLEDDQAYEQFMSDMKSYPGFVEVSRICQDYGYILYRLIRSKYDIDIIIRSTDKYHAGIYRQHKFSRNTYEFEAQTTALGSLGYEEYRKFKDAVDDTYELLMNLNSIDFDTLDIIEYYGED